MINSRNTKRYLLYAFGEIILVMIGILLALQVNTWNEERKLRTSEDFLLTQLDAEVRSNHSQLSEAMKDQEWLHTRYWRSLMEWIKTTPTPTWIQCLEKFNGLGPLIQAWEC